MNIRTLGDNTVERAGLDPEITLEMAKNIVLAQARILQEIRAAFLEKGKFAEAAEALQKGELFANWEAAYLRGCVLVRLGRHEDAVHSFKLANEFGAPLVDRLWLESDPAIRQAVLEALAVANERCARIIDKCAILGRYNRVIDPLREQMVKQILDAYHEAWGAGHTPAPRLSTVFTDISAGTSEAISVNGPRILLVCARHIHASPEYMESDFHYNYLHSAKSYGIDITVFDADEIITYNLAFERPAAIVQSKLAALRQMILEHHFDIVLFEGNFEPLGQAIKPEFWHSLKALRKFFLIMFTSDCYALPDPIRVWGDVADLVLIGDTDNHNYASSRIKHKLLYLPMTMPFHEVPHVRTSTDEDFDVGYAGSRSRNRELFLCAAILGGLKVHSVFHDRRANQMNSETYRQTMRLCKMTFNNGYIDYRKSIMTGRVFEAVIARSLLLQEDGGQIANFLVPFIHYIPVANIHQFVIFAQFFAKHEEYRLRITEAALQFHRSHYSAELFWRALVGMVRLAAQS